MMTSLSVQMMQLSDDPNDVTPVRWYWCQPGAQPITWPTVFCFGIWEDERRNPYSGPQIKMVPSSFRGSEISPYPGLDQYGIQDWWENGLPKEARGGPPFDINMGTERWDSRVVVNGAFFVDDGTLPVDGEGGQVEGGQAYTVFAVAWQADGGQAEGGEAIFPPPYYMTEEGGQVEGGEALTLSGVPWVADGGQEEGGEALTYRGFPVRGCGGQVEGGAAHDQADLSVHGEGGQSQGGAAFGPPSYYLVAEGGQWEGGEAGAGEFYRLESEGGQDEGGEATVSSGTAAVPPVRVTQEVVEVVRTGTPAARVTQEVVEVLRTGSPAARVTQEVVEVLRK